VVKLMTDGILLAETQTDPLLRQYDTIIIDEAHERSLNIDFLLGYLKQLLPAPRPEDHHHLGHHRRRPLRPPFRPRGKGDGRPGDRGLGPPVSGGDALSAHRQPIAAASPPKWRRPARAEGRASQARRTANNAT
jgi:hypothetical protein